MSTTRKNFNSYNGGYTHVEVDNRSASYLTGKKAEPFKKLFYRIKTILGYGGNAKEFILTDSGFKWVNELELNS